MEVILLDGAAEAPERGADVILCLNDAARTGWARPDRDQARDVRVGLAAVKTARGFG